MTRKEQILQRSLELYPPIYSSTREREAFIQGAQWSDNNPNLTWEDIRKICIVAENVHKYYGFWSQSVYEAILNELNDPE